jgi:hypothetical protein
MAFFNVDTSGADQKIKELQKMIDDLGNASVYQCAAFAACGNAAEGWVSHPVLKIYPSCKRCADRLGATLNR